MTLGRQIQIILLIFSLLPVLISGSLNYYLVSKDLSTIEEEQVVFAQDATRRTLDFLADKIKQGVNSYGFWDDAHNALQNNDIDWINEQLIEVAAEDYGLSFIQVSDSKGKVIGSFGDEDFGINITNNPLLQKVSKGEEKIIKGLYNSRHGLALVAVGRILNNNGEGEAAGYLIFGQYLTKEHILTVKNLTGADVSVLSPKGQGLLTTDEKLNSLISDSGRSEIKRFNSEESNYLAAFSPLEDINGTEIARQGTIIKVVASDQAKDNLFITIISIIVGCLVLALGGGFLIANYLVKPLGVISKLLGYIGQGDFTHRYEKHMQGEIGEMVKTYNKMVDNLKDLIVVTKDSAGRVVGSLEEVLKRTDTLAEASREIREGITEVASASESSLNKTIVTTNDIGKMANGITEISTASSTVLFLARDVQTASEAGLEAINKIKGRMNFLTDKAEETGLVVSALGENTQRINDIVEAITEIAEKTNLLALNAAIESARAGEHGRGFSVVADEVRKLAEGSAESAKEIKQVIIDILKGTEAAVVSMTEQSKIISQGASEVNEAGVIFEQMKHTFSMVKDKVEGISLETVDLDSQGKNAVLEVQAAQNDAALVMDRARIISATASSQMEIMEETSKFVRELSILAERMEELAGKFKVK